MNHRFSTLLLLLLALVTFIVVVVTLSNLAYRSNSAPAPSSPPAEQSERER